MPSVDMKDLLLLLRVDFVERVVLLVAILVEMEILLLHFLKILPKIRRGSDP